MEEEKERKRKKKSGIQHKRNKIAEYEDYMELEELREEMNFLSGMKIKPHKSSKKKK